MPDVELGKYKKIKGISEMLGIPEATIKKWVKSNKIPHYWMGGIFLRFDISEVVEWANNKGYMAKPDDE